MDAQQEIGHVGRLKNVAAEEHSACPRVHNAADRIDHFLVRSSAASAKDQDWNGTGADHLAHGLIVIGILGFDHVGAKFRSHPSVQHEPFRLARVLNVGAASQ